MQIQLQRASLAGPSDRGQHCQTGHPKENLRQRSHSPTMIIGHRRAPCSRKESYYTAALDAGGRDDGPPGVYTEYHAHYFAAFLLDPDGH